MELVNKKLDLEQFWAERQEVLQSWPTGRGVDLEEAIAYHKQLPASKVMAKKLAQGKREGITFAQPRAGVALLHEHIELLRYLQDEGGADFLPTTIDSYTRQNRYKEAETGIEESRAAGRSMLNGFPAVNYGVDACRKVVEAVNVPVQVRHGTPDARLLAEITLAGGFTDFEGGGISYNIPYSKDMPLEKSIRYWQYVDRLVGYYEENGVSINREPFGPLTGTLVPPSISHAVAIIEALLAAEQGVMNLTLGYGQCGNLYQDVAAIRTLAELAEEYLNRFGYSGRQITTVFHQWMGGFPQDESKAFGVISWGAVTAALARVNKVIVKTPHEAMGIPTREANAAGLKATKQVLNMLKDQSLPLTSELQLEMEMIRKETRAILDKTLELGEGDWAVGAVRAFKAGVIDVPFAPSRHNLGKILPARDNQGAVRFLDFGQLPFDAEIRAFHQEKIAERGRKENRQPSFQMVIDDIYAIGKGMLVGRPR
ncbi:MULTISPECIES: methylaspartate mutase subunit E [Carboxydocella]|uniref:Glutamate mutase epsilon subunit n=2 Tax=Carboxydocella TaxID=178898 RepID=A0A1T4LFD5_9FIRM|nr:MULTISPECIES: methylaspartate mutase subunit E [Carboxydocella]AVX19817.1 Glutamate mutase subunit E [Carboxydocella thermautotrophica]AVX30226.1 Glutamate mutase subunit E [Carboxydocella thermautotrophica]SJZ53278.1 Glutamate mutase subunit E [Carboxydocella sporoproducens DSM 16521]GAW28640.1 methylaspartate mutase subunit E [Carboxydocella sp. ULO1]GAW31738.1 methylaspartate mutase subunit E [Carboxydocella sp. JDF658]